MMSHDEEICCLALVISSVTKYKRMLLRSLSPRPEPFLESQAPAVIHPQAQLSNLIHRPSLSPVFYLYLPFH